MKNEATEKGFENMADKQRKEYFEGDFSLCEQVVACVCAHVWFSWSAHVMTLGPRRPVLSLMLEIFRAMAMRGPSTTCSGGTRHEKQFQGWEFNSDC